MKAPLLLCLLVLVACSANRIADSPEPMTPAGFQEIVSKPGDAVSLKSPLSSIPIWTNVVISNVMTYASGKVFQEEMMGTTHTVEGKYIVCSVDSKFYQKTMHCILTYDVKAAAFKTYAFYADGNGNGTVTESTTIYNFATKTYTVKSEYDDFKESTTGSYTDTEEVSKTLVYKDGALFLTRETTTRPVIK